MAALILGLAGGWLLAHGGLGGSPLSLFTTASASGRMSVLVLGADDRPGEPGRSDTAILVSVDFSQNKVTMLSVPRDSWANIPGRGWDKFNHAYAFGKEQLTLKTFNNVFGIMPDHYVVVNMQGFQKIVDTLGGVTIDVEKDLNYEDPYDTPPLKIHLKHGVQRLNGVQALGYVRFRHDSESDGGRQARQQKFIKALAAEALRPQNLTKLPTLSSQLYGAIRTDMSRTDLLRLGMALAKGLDPQSMGTAELKGVDRTFGGIYYLQLNLTEARGIVYKMVNGKDPDPAFAAKTQTAQREYLASITKEQERQAALTKAAEDAAKKAAAQTGQGTGASAPGQTGQPGSATQPGTATGGTTPGGETDTPASVARVSVRDASGKNLGPRYAGLFSEQGMQITQVSTEAAVSGTTEIIIHQADAATLQKVMSLLPNAKLVIQAAGPGTVADIEIVLGQDLAQ